MVRAQASLSEPRWRASIDVPPMGRVRRLNTAKVLDLRARDEDFPSRRGAGNDNYLFLLVPAKGFEPLTP
jgi:hypothetical protein